MSSRRSARGISAVAGAAALIGMGFFTAACSSEGSEEPSTSTTTPTTTSAPATTTGPAVSPTENMPVPPSGGNKFTPTHVETPAPPTGRHGNHSNGG